METLETHPNRQCHICTKPLPSYNGHGRQRTYCPPLSGERYSKCEEEARRQTQACFNRVLDAESRKTQQNVRTFLKRQRNTALATLPPWLIGTYLDDSSTTKTARFEDVFEQLQYAKQHLVSGKIAPDVIATNIEALQSSLASWANKDATTARLYVSCEEILRDLGEQGDSAEACQQLVQRSLKIERYWVLQKEPLPLAKALLTHVAILRIEIDRNPNSESILFPSAMRLMRAIEHILRKQGRKRDAQTAVRLHHHAVALKLRLIAHHKGELPPRSASRERKLLHTLANELKSPQTLMSTFQEEAAALLLCGEGDEAAECLAEAKRLLPQDPSSLAPQAQLALLRREIELQLMKRKLSEAQSLMHTYHQVLQRYPNAYYLRHLNRWVHEYRLRPISQPTLTPAYSTGMVYHFYCEEELSS